MYSPIPSGDVGMDVSAGRGRQKKLQSGNLCPELLNTYVSSLKCENTAKCYPNVCIYNISSSQEMVLCLVKNQTCAWSTKLHEN